VNKPEDQREDQVVDESMNRIQWEADMDSSSVTNIKVVGVGGGGCNAVDDMVSKGFKGVEFFAVNTDFQALHRCSVTNHIQIGKAITHGLGAGAIPELGEEAARSAEGEIRTAIEGSDMVFITAGMGGGTGTGAAPVIAEIARSMNILCVAIVTKPFTFEGPKRMKRAVEGIKRFKEHVDTMIVIMNDKLMDTVGPKTPITEAFQVVNGVLAQAIRAISDLISMPGLINVDFRDIRTIMGETGGAVMGVGVGRGENRSIEAVKKACHSPLQEKIVIDGATGVLINITGGPDITMLEINDATSAIYETADEDANIIFGVVIDGKMKDEMRVTIIATGFNEVTDSDVSGFASGRPLMRPRETGFNKQTLTAPRVEDESDAEQGEPDPEPALLRKRGREAMKSPGPEVDFDSDENPLREWDHESSVIQDHDDDQDAPDNPHEESVVVSASFHDSATEEGKTSGTTKSDPYDIPALHRRRKHRFFE
jgi:cell division protein FtsZ